MKEYRLIEGFGQHWNKRFEVQEKYYRYEGEKRIKSWHIVFHCANKKRAEEVLKKYQTEPQKNYYSPDVIPW